MEWSYEKYDENYKLISCPPHDNNGEITGKVIIGLKAYFDENPEERIKLGWIKHYRYTYKEIEEMYDNQTQYYVEVPKMIDDYTIQDEIVVMDKTEEMLAYEELITNGRSNSFYWSLI